MDHILVVVLESKIFPDDVVRFTSNQQRYGAASEVGAFRADVECVPAVGPVRRILSEESIDGCFLLPRIQPPERRYAVDSESRRQRHSIDYKVEEAPLGAA